MNVEKKQPIDVLVIGSGMYAIGKGTNGYGTIIPSLFQSKKEGYVGNIYISGTKTENQIMIDTKIKELNKKMGTDYKVEYYPKNKNDKKAYKEIIEKQTKNICGIICVPDHLHFEIARDLIEKKVPNLVVKPLSSSVDEVKKLIELQKENNVYCAVEFHKRFDEANLKIREIIPKKEIGEPLYFLFEFSQKNSIPIKYFKK